MSFITNSIKSCLHIPSTTQICEKIKAYPIASALGAICLIGAVWAYTSSSFFRQPIPLSPPTTPAAPTPNAHPSEGPAAPPLRKPTTPTPNAYSPEPPAPKRQRNGSPTATGGRERKREAQQDSLTQPHHPVTPPAADAPPPPPSDLMVRLPRRCSQLERLPSELMQNVLLWVGGPALYVSKAIEEENKRAKSQFWDLIFEKNPIIIPYITVIKKELNFSDNKWNELPSNEKLDYLCKKLAILIRPSYLNKKEWGFINHLFNDFFYIKIIEKIEINELNYSSLEPTLQKAVGNRNVAGMRELLNNQNNSADIQAVTTLTVADPNPENNIILTDLPPEIAHFTNLQNLRIHYSSITHLPNYIPKSLTSLSFQGDIQLWSDDLNQRLPRLKILSLNQNRPVKIPREIFYNSPQTLEELTVNNYEIETLPNNLNQSLPNLKILCIAINPFFREKILDFPDHLPPTLTGLHLYLQLKNMPINLNATLPNLKELSLQIAQTMVNKHKPFPNDLPKKLESLHIIGLEVLPISLAEQLPRLKELYLIAVRNSEKERSEKPKSEIPHLTQNLEQMEIRNYNIPRVPDDLDKRFPKLTALRLDGNGITKFPRTLPSKLELLHLHDNPITILPNPLPEKPLGFRQLGVGSLYRRSESGISPEVQGTLEKHFIK